MNDLKNYSSVELAYLIVGAARTSDIKAELYARDAELAQLRARLAAQEPLAQAAVALDSAIWQIDIQGKMYELVEVARAYARAQAQDGAA